MSIIDKIRLNEHEIQVIPELTDSEKAQYLVYLCESEYRKGKDPNLSSILESYFSSLDEEDEIDFISDDEDYDAEFSIDEYADDELDDIEAVDFMQFDLSEEKNKSDKIIVDVTMDDNYILVESNSLKYLRKTLNKFVENGYILVREFELENDFKESKTLRYIRVFEIISITVPICLN